MDKKIHKYAHIKSHYSFEVAVEMTYLHVVKCSDTFSVFILPDPSAAFEIAGYFLLFETFFFTSRTLCTIHVDAAFFSFRRESAVAPSHS